MCFLTISISTTVTIKKEDLTTVACKNVLPYFVEKDETKSYWFITQRSSLDFDKENEQEYQIDNSSFFIRKAENNGGEALIKIEMTGIPIKSFMHTFEVIFFRKSDKTKKIRFISEATLDNTAAKDTSISDLMKAITYSGRNGNFSYDDNGVETVIIRRDPIKVDENTFTVDTSPFAAKAATENSVYFYNCLLDNDDPTSYYYYNPLSLNWGFWLWNFFYFGYLLITVFLSDTMDALDIKETIWSFHPVYSVRYFVSIIYPKKMRMGVLFIEMTSMAFFLSLLTQKAHDVHLAIRLIVFPIVSMVFAIVPTWIGGFLVVNYQNAFRDYVKEIKSHDDNLKERIQSFNRLESNSFRREYLFYCYGVFVGMGLNVGTIFFMHQQLQVDHGWFILSVVIAVAMHLCFLDIIVVFLCKVTIFKKLFKYKGYYFDSHLQTEYDEVSTSHD
jgi:hypothetical protein